MQDVPTPIEQGFTRDVEREMSAPEALATGVTYGFKHTLVPAIIRKLSQPSFIEDKNYNVMDDAPERFPDLVIRYPEAFIVSRSREQTDWIASELQKYEQELAQMANAGVFGMVGGFAGGLIDPIMLVPLAGWAGKAKQAKTLADVAKVAGSASWQIGGAAALSEYAGSIADPVHDPKDTITAGFVGAAAGALLGGAPALYKLRIGKVLENAVREAEEGGVHRMAVNSDGKTPEEAIKNLVDPGGVYEPNIAVKAVNKINKLISPVVRTLESPFESARKIQGVLSDAGLVTKTAADGKVVAEVGTIENRMHRNFGPLAEALQKKEELYLKYATGKEGKAFAPERAGFANMLAFVGIKKKMTAHEFDLEVVKAMANGGEHKIPEVRAAAKAARDALVKIGKEMEAVGMLKEGTAEAMANSKEWYIPFALDYSKILADPHRFVNDLLPYIRAGVEEHVKNWSAKKAARMKTLEAVKKDLSKPEQLVKTVEELQRKVEALRAEIDKKFPAFRQLTGKPLTVGTIKQLKKLEMPRGMLVTVRDESGNLTIRPMKKSEWEEAVRKTVEAVKRKPEWKKYVEEEALASARLKELRKFAPPPKAAERAAQTVKEAPEKAGKIVERAAARVSKFITLKKKTLPELSKLKSEFKKLSEDLKKLEREGLVLSDQFNRLMKRAGRVLERKDAKESAIASEFWKEMEAAYKEVISRAAERTLELGKKLGKAEEKLNVDKKAIEKRIADIEAELEAMRLESPPFEVVTKDGKVDIDKTAENFLWDVVVRKNKQGPDNNPLLRMMVTEERGSELARRAFRNVPNNVMYPWIHNDMTSMMRTYFRTVAGDIELMRTFGTTSVKKILEPLYNEFRDKLKAAKTVKERDAIVSAFHQAEKDLTAEILRVRGMWGLPDNPDSWIQRFGEGMLHHNVSTKLGMVLFPSTGDFAKTMLKAGPTKFVRSAIKVLVSKLKKETKGWNPTSYALSLGVTERLMATRLKQLAETADRVATAGPILRAERWIAGKSLTLTGLPLLNQFMKEVAITTSATFYNNAIQRLAEKGPSALTKKELQLLAQFGIDRKMAQRIMEQVRKDPFTYWDEFGNWFENTARWDDSGARLVYEAMLSGEANRYVVTPGLEKPLWADASILGRNLYQFRGYLFSSTQKILTAGLQHPDAAFAATAATSMVLGAGQLWLRGQLVGGEFKKKMDQWTTAKWMDEAIDQSGMLGILTEGNRMLQMLGFPLLSVQWWVDGSKQYPARYAGQNVWSAIGGPTASTLMYDAGPLIGELVSAMSSEDNEISAKVIRRGRALTWFNNHLLMRHGFDMLEQQLIESLDLPEASR